MADIQKCKIGGSDPDAVMFDTYKESTYNGTACYDIGSDECWDAYLGDGQVWHKDKTFENYYKGKGLATTYEQSSNGTVYMSSEVLSASTLDEAIKDKNLIIKPITDLEDIIYSYSDGVIYGLVFHVKPVNKEEFWTPIKEWFAKNYVNCGFLHYVDATNFYGVGRFGNSNIYGELTLNFDNVDGRGNGYNAQYYPFRYCSGITKLIIHAKDTTQDLAWTSMNSCFNTLSGCTELEYDGAPNGPTDVSDCFTGCKFSTWPRNLMRYDAIKISNYMIDGGSIKVIPLCSLSDDRFAACNTLKIKGDQIFRCDWTDIMPCLDASEYKAGYITFGNWSGSNPSAVNCRIKNWNCNYSFDGDKTALGYNTGFSANLPNLDADSVGYLMENLTDLTKYDAEITVENGNINSFDAWWVSGNSSNVTKAHAYAQTTANGSIIACNSFGKTGTIKITVSGLVGGTLTCYYGSTLLATITEDGDYDIEVTDTTNNQIRFQLSGNTSFTNPVKITLRNPYTAGAAFSDSGTLYVPSNWETTYDAVEGNDFDTLVASAVAKGWTVYVGGTEREV